MRLFESVCTPMSTLMDIHRQLLDDNPISRGPLWLPCQALGDWDPTWNLALNRAESSRH